MKLFEVKDKGKSYIVNLDNKLCDCRAWSISGIPCKHALLCILHNNGDICDYVDDCFKKKTYFRTYGGSIHPLLDKSMWHPMSIDEIIPLLMGKVVEKPKVNRRRELDEMYVHQKSYTL